MIEYAYIHNGAVSAPQLADKIEDILPLVGNRRVMSTALLPKEVTRLDEDSNEEYLDTIFEEQPAERTVYFLVEDYKVRVLDYDTGSFKIIDGKDLQKMEMPGIHEQLEGRFWKELEVTS